MTVREKSAGRAGLLIGLSVLTGLSILIGCLMSDNPRVTWSMSRPVATTAEPEPEPVLKAKAVIRLDRSPRKEPQYSGTPRYFLLLLGSKRREIWCVCDDDWIYIDRDGDGDLTDRDEAIWAGIEVMVHDGDVAHRVRFGTVKEGSNGKPGHIPVWVRARDVFDQYTFVTTDKKSERPQTARVYHFDGKLIMRSLANKDFCFVRGELQDLRAVVETIDSDWVVVKNSKTVPENANPIARIEFPGRTSARSPIVEVSLSRRC